MDQNFIENEIIILTKQTLDIFLKEINPSELISLYTFYYYTAKWQKTNQVKATEGYVKKGLSWGSDKMRSAQKKLIELGLIDKVIRKDSKGKIVGWYIKMNYIFKKENDKYILDNQIEFKLTYNQNKTRQEFEEMKKKDKHLYIYERDNWKCAYCNHEVFELKKMYKLGKTHQEIAKIMRENKDYIASIDHIIPISKDGDNTSENLITSCMKCNSEKGIQMTHIPHEGLSTSGNPETNSLSSYKENALNTNINTLPSNEGLNNEPITNIEPIRVDQSQSPVLTTGLVESAKKGIKKEPKYTPEEHSVFKAMWEAFRSEHAFTNEKVQAKNLWLIVDRLKLLAKNKNILLDNLALNMLNCFKWLRENDKKGFWSTMEFTPTKMLGMFEGILHNLEVVKKDFSERERQKEIVSQMKF